MKHWHRLQHRRTWKIRLIFSERRQLQRTTYCMMIPLVWKVQRRQIPRHRKWISAARGWGCLLKGYGFFWGDNKRVLGLRQWQELHNSEYTSSLLCCCLVAKSPPTLLRTHGLEPARLLCPWDFPGKKTGVGYHFLLQGGSSWPRDWPFYTGRQSLYQWTIRKAHPRSYCVVNLKRVNCMVFYVNFI